MIKRNVAVYKTTTNFELLLFEELECIPIAVKITLYVPFAICDYYDSTVGFIFVSS